MPEAAPESADGRTGVDTGGGEATVDERVCSPLPLTGRPPPPPPPIPPADDLVDDAGAAPLPSPCTPPPPPPRPSCRPASTPDVLVVADPDFFLSAEPPPPRIPAPGMRKPEPREEELRVGGGGADSEGCGRALAVTAPLTWGGVCGTCAGGVSGRGREGGGGGGDTLANAGVSSRDFHRCTGSQQ